MGARPAAKGNELRAYPRRHVEIEITLESDSQFYAGFSENLSEGGVFVATHAIQRVGSRVDVAFTLPAFRKRIRVEGEVRWVRPYSEGSGLAAGMGLRFVALRPEDAETIREFCAQRAPLFYEE